MSLPLVPLFPALISRLAPSIYKATPHTEVAFIPLENWGGKSFSFSVFTVNRIKYEPPSLA